MLSGPVEKADYVPIRIDAFVHENGLKVCPLARAVSGGRLRVDTRAVPRGVDVHAVEKPRFAGVG